MFNVALRRFGSFYILVFSAYYYLDGGSCSIHRVCLVELVLCSRSATCSKRNIQIEILQRLLRFGRHGSMPQRAPALRIFVRRLGGALLVVLSRLEMHQSALHFPQHFAQNVLPVHGQLRRQNSMDPLAKLHTQRLDTEERRLLEQLLVHEPRLLRVRMAHMQSTLPEEIEYIPEALAVPVHEHVAGAVARDLEPPREQRLEVRAPAQRVRSRREVHAADVQPDYAPDGHAPLDVGET
jgi:hypothetical protein